MGRLSKWILYAVAVLLVASALLVSALRLAMPYMDHYRPQIFAAISSATEVELDADRLQGSWKSFGPTIAVNNLTATLADGSHLQVKKVTLALDIWQSLLHAKLQFRDLTFWQLHFSLQSLTSHATHNDAGYDSDKVKTLFLQRFDHFILRESSVDFPSPSGQRVTLNIPALTWFNEGKSHRAEGLVSLSSFTGQHGTAQVRINLQDKESILDKGTLWLRVDDIDAKPWLGNWTNKNTNLKKAHLSLTAWVNIAQGTLDSGDLVVNQGDAQWQEGGKASHQLQLDNLTAQLRRAGEGFTLTIPDTTISIDDVRWPKGALALYWRPQPDKPWLPAAKSDIRIRAHNIILERLSPLVTLLSPIDPEYANIWQQAEPQGTIDYLAADLPSSDLAATQFQGAWHDLSWQAWQQVPAVKALQGSVSGSVSQGELNLQAGEQTLSSQGQLQAPLELRSFAGTFGWDTRQKNLFLSGKDISVRAKSIEAQGNFDYQQRDQQAPHLAILAGINVSNGADAWRYFPIKIMPKGLVNYLSTAIQGGKTQDATLLFAGNPHNFPFLHNEGMFQVSVPLKQAKFVFQPGWPALSPLDIDLNFVNNGLWMSAASIQLGKVPVSQVTANIPDYHKEQLFINGDIRGQGAEVHHYLKQTPLADSVGNALDQLQVTGEVFGHLALDIPLDGKPVIAQGDVNLTHNQVMVEPLNSKLSDVSGRFTYNNGRLESGPLSAQWFGQPVQIAFSTLERPTDFGVNIQLNGDWQLANISAMPDMLRQQLQGRLPWQSTVDIQIPHEGETRYQVKIQGEASGVRGKLPSALGINSQQAIPVKVNASGDLHQLTVAGSVNRNQQFATQWQFSPGLTLTRGIWRSDSLTPVALPKPATMVVHLPAIDGTKLYAASQSTSLDDDTPAQAQHSVKKSGSTASQWSDQLPFTFPNSLIVDTPELRFIGQKWRNLSLNVQKLRGQPEVGLQGDEVRGNVTMRSSLPWLVNLDYLYYNPQFAPSAPEKALPQQVKKNEIDSRHWPQVDADCRSCWFAGQNFGRVKGKMRINQQRLSLSDGVIDTGHSRLALSGEWNNVPGEQRTAIKGHLRSDNLAEMARWFGQQVPISDTPLNLGYDLHWRDIPWQPEINSMSGLLTLKTGKGAFQHVGTGTAGQVLRLLSIDALLRKLSLDFRGTFDTGFYYDSIAGTAWIDKGVLRTDNLNIDGLEADIGMSGKVDLVKRQFDLVATVAPEISVPVGVAAAFAINPIVGASVFVASKVLSPLWSKISLLRYSISGPMDKPVVQEVLRK